MAGPAIEAAQEYLDKNQGAKVISDYDHDDDDDDYDDQLGLLKNVWKTTDGPRWFSVMFLYIIQSLLEVEPSVFYCYSLLFIVYC